MNRNQKIALGCGGAGCLGLIVVVIAGVLFYLVYRPPVRRSYNYNVSTNRNSNSNDNSDSNTNTNINSESSNSSSSSSPGSSMSEDDKHKLYQAAGVTGDAELIRRVSVKIGIMDADYTPGENYSSFIAAHLEWAMHNTDFIQSVNTPDKARAYLSAHLD
jgi:hypothetical protein